MHAIACIAEQFSSVLSDRSPGLPDFPHGLTVVGQRYMTVFITCIKPFLSADTAILGPQIHGLRMG